MELCTSRTDDMNPGMIRTGVNFLSGSFVLDVLGLDISAQSENVSSFHYYAELRTILW